MAGKDNKQNKGLKAEDIASNTRSRSQIPSLMNVNTPKAISKPPEAPPPPPAPVKIDAQPPIRPQNPIPVFDPDQTILASNAMKNMTSPPNVMSFNTLPPPMHSTLMQPPHIPPPAYDNRAHTRMLESQLQETQEAMQQQTADRRKDRDTMHRLHMDIQKMQQDMEKAAKEREQERISYMAQIQELLNRPSQPNTPAHQDNHTQQASSNAHMRHDHHAQGNHTQQASSNAHMRHDYHAQGTPMHQNYSMQNISNSGDINTKLSESIIQSQQMMMKSFAAQAYELEPYEGKGSVTQWIKAFIQHQQETGLNGKMLLRAKLHKSAREWYNEQNYDDWVEVDEILSDLKLRYGRSDSEKQKSKAAFYSAFQAPDESRQEFISRMQKLCRGMKLTQREFIHQTVLNIRPEHDAEILLGMVEDKLDTMTINDLRKHSMMSKRTQKEAEDCYAVEQHYFNTDAKPMEQYNNKPEFNRGRSTIRRSNQPHVNFEPRNQTPGRPRYPRDKTKDRRGASGSRTRSGSRTKRHNDNPGLCDRCGKTTCDSARSGDNHDCFYYKQSVECSICKKIGHPPDMCWNKPE